MTQTQIYLIGIMDDKIAAHTRIAIVKTMFDGMDTFAILNHVSVKPDYRHHHIATHMLDAIKQSVSKRLLLRLNFGVRNSCPCLQLLAINALVLLPTMQPF